MSNNLVQNELKNETALYFKRICETTSNDYSKIAFLGDELSWFDVLSMLVFGFIGGAISNSEQLKDFLDNIHTEASSDSHKLF